MKLTDLLFVVYLLVTGRRRAAATALGVFAAAGVLGFLLTADSVDYWLHGTFAAANRISDVAGLSNHSLNGLLARLGLPALCRSGGGARHSHDRARVQRAVRAGIVSPADAVRAGLRRSGPVCVVGTTGCGRCR